MKKSNSQTKTIMETTGDLLVELAHGKYFTKFEQSLELFCS